MVPIALLAAALAALAPADSGKQMQGDSSAASSRLSAVGTASVRIQRGFAMTAAAFGTRVEGARARKAFITQRKGERRQANLIEFE